MSWLQFTTLHIHSSNTFVDLMFYKFASLWPNRVTMRLSKSVISWHVNVKGGVFHLTSRVFVIFAIRMLSKGCTIIRYLWVFGVNGSQSWRISEVNYHSMSVLMGSRSVKIISKCDLYPMEWNFSYFHTLGLTWSRAITTFMGGLWTTTVLIVVIGGVCGTPSSPSISLPYGCCGPFLDEAPLSIAAIDFNNRC